MKKIKSEKGITLVALIITIVVLLILAVVAVTAIQNDGILAHANNAATRFETEQGIENGRLNDYEGILNNYAGTGGCSHELGEPVYTSGTNEHTVKISCTKCNEVISETEESCALSLINVDATYDGDDRNNHMHNISGTCTKCNGNYSKAEEKCTFQEIYSYDFDGYHTVSYICKWCGYSDWTREENFVGCTTGDDGTCIYCGHWSCGGEHTIFDTLDEDKGYWDTGCTWWCYSCDTPVNFEHTWENGICTRCGEIEPSEECLSGHNNLDKEYYNISGDEDYCYWECKACGYSYDFQHKFDGDTCIDCGYTK